MPPIQSHLGLLSRIIIQKEKRMRKMKWKFDSDVIIICLLFFSLSLTVASQASDHGPFSPSSLSLSLFHLLFVKPLVDPRRIRAIQPDNPRRDQKHNPFHLHFLLRTPSWKHSTKTPESPMFSHLRSMSISISFASQKYGALKCQREAE